MLQFPFYAKEYKKGNWITMNFKNFKHDFIKHISSESYAKILTIYSEMNFLTYKWMRDNNVKIVNCPITTQSISSPMGLGSDSLPYKVISKNNPNFEFYLADSMQFHLELFLRTKNVESVGYIAPTFRGENVDERHLHQFNHFEIETKKPLVETKKMIINYLKYLVKNLVKTHSAELNYFNENNVPRLLKWLNFDQYNLLFTNAIKILDEKFKEGIDRTELLLNINSKGEKFLINYFSDKILWLDNFPEINVPFYQKSKDGFAINSDLLMGIGEIVGSGERCFDYNETLKSLLNHKNNPQNYKWYLEMKEKTPMITSGFGLGMERLTLFLIGKNDIREVQLIPRETDKEILP
ncbi:asparagine synthetase A [Mesomycoplasma hyopneumoniae]|uniref:asparagine synthetase A n=1 Tax=Mesomycoplasma hyopneumoniae TaxID=2099 RepID=UPI0011B720DD|nr:asparagine synthetase A [Mesomycoplasma hyopneumoniae]